MRSRTLLAACLLFSFACKKAPPPPAAPAADDKLPAAAADDEVHAVYGDNAGPADPLAEQLCTALHALPEERRAACCKIAPGIVMTSECVKVVSAALRSKAVSIDAALAQGCAAAMDRTLQGCAWPGPWGAGVPAECRRLFTGHLDSGAVCRSSLECKEGLRCRGVGPTAAGHCDRPLPSGERCALAVDTLAVYSREELEPGHPECAGFCGHLRCFDRIKEGGKCASALDCAPGLHCAGTVCKSGAASAVGEACVGGGCADGARCVQGICAQPRETGACKEDSECKGGCLKKPGEPQGVCGMRCDLR